MLFAKDFRMHAREALRGRWFLAAAVGLVAALLGGATTGGSSGIKFQVNNMDGVSVSLPWGGSYPLFGEHVMAVVAPAILTILAVALFWAIIMLIIGGAVSLGYVKFNLNLVDDTNPQLGDILSQFHRFKDGFILNLLTFIYTFLWMLCLVIPGIIAAYSYSMAPYLLYENPDMTPSEAIAGSKEMMRGNKFRLFCLDLSFIGWDILCSFTFGIGNLFLRPYKESARAVFYRELKDGKYSNPYVEGTASEYE
ncbi:MAG: DUF975 family protein [Lachnospiraceae bacterium]